MKRFAALCAIMALISLYVVSWATAPSVRDLPDVRLLTGGGKGVISAGLNTSEMDAYNLQDFIKDFDQGVGGVSITVGDVSMVNPPPDINTPNSDTPVPTIEKDGSDNVDIYGRNTAGWAIYTVTVDDTTAAHLTQENAFAKYSTFSLGTPSLSAGRFFDLTAAGWQLAYVTLGDTQDTEVADLDVTLDPPATSVTWEAYFNNLVMMEDANGDIVGINPAYVDHGASFTTSSGWGVSISAQGGLVLSYSGTLSPGPFLVGILATKEGTTDDQDGTRILVSAGLVGAAVPAESPPPGHDESETLDTLSAGAITAPLGPSGVLEPPIRPGSHWMYWLQNDDLDLVPADLAVVDLDTFDGGLLPPAARPGSLKGVIDAPAESTIAGGMGIRATLVGSDTAKSGFRLVSRMFNGAQPGDVYTFAVNVATDITNATHSPNINMGITSALGAMISGTYMEQYGSSNPLVAGTALGEYSKDIVPFADDGWQTMSVNYTPPVSYRWFDVVAPLGEMNQDDIDALVAVLAGREDGVTDPIESFRASIKMWTRDGSGFGGLNDPMTDTFHLWMDNFRVYKSAFELDLGYEVTEWTTPVSTSGFLPPAANVPEPSGSVDGTFEGSSTDLDAIGWAVGDGNAGPEPWYSPTFRYVDAGSGAVSINTSVDHTKSSSSNCLQIQLPSTGDSAGNNYRSLVVSGVVGPGTTPGASGIYGVEVYASQARQTNQLISDRQPALKLSLQTLAPISLGPNYNALVVYGGLPYIGLEEDNWLRIVMTAYIVEAQIFRAALVVEETFGAGLIDPTRLSDDYDVPIYFDDVRIYSVDDPAKFFDADLFDSI